MAPVGELAEALLESASVVSADPVVSGARWEHLCIFFCLTALSQFAWIMYSATPTISRSAFDATASQVTFIATVFPLLYLPGCFLAARATRRGGLRGAMREASLWLLGGAAVRACGCLAGWLLGSGRLAYVCVVAGQALMALGQPHLVNAPAQVAQEWFPASERETAATTGLLGNIVGQALGEALSPAIAAVAADSLGLGDRGAALALSASALAPVAACGCWTWARFRPSPNACKGTATTGSLVDDWRLILRDGHFRQLFAAFCVGLGAFTAILTMVAQWLAPCGYSSATAGSLGATFVLVGVPSAGAVALRLDATRDYKGYVKRVALADLAATLLVAAAAQRGDAALLYVAFGALGGAIVATSAVLMETAVECTYPTSPEVSTGLLFCSGNALSILSTYAIQFLIDLQRGTCEPLFSRRGHAPVAAFLVANIAFCFLLLVTYDGPYRRLDAEHDHDLRRSRASGDTMASLAPCDFDLSYADDDPPPPAASPAAVV